MFTCGCVGFIPSGLSTLCLVGFALSVAFNAALAAPSMSIAEGPGYFSRLSFGLAFVREKELQISTGVWTHVFHLRLPNISDANSMPHPCMTNSSACLPHCQANCAQLYELIASVNALTVSLRQSIANFIRRAHAVVPEIHSLTASTPRRRARAPLDIIGDASHWLFGTARVSDLNELRAALAKIQTGLELSSADVLKSRQGILAISRLQNERLDKLHTVLRQEQSSLNVLQADTKAAAENSLIEISALTAVTQELSRFITVHDQIEALSYGLDQTLTQTLSPKLVTVSQLRNVMQEIQAELARNATRLCYTSPREVYASRNFDITRAQSDVLIRVFMPITQHPRFTLYKVIKFASVINGPYTYASRIREFPAYVVINPTTGLVGELHEPPQAAVVDSARITWHKTGSPSCVRSILFDHVNDTMKYCDFSVTRTGIVPALTKLVDGVYVAANYSDLQIKCPDSTRTPTASCSLCLIQVACGCVLQTANETLAQERDCHSEHDSSSNILHAVNLALLNKFYNLTNTTLSGRSLVPSNRAVTPQPITLPIFGQNVEKILASDQAASYSLEKLVSALDNQSTVYNTPADALLHSVLERLSEPPSLWKTTSDWLAGINCLVYLIVAALMVAWYKTHQRLNVVSAALMLGVTKTQAYELRNQYVYSQPTEAAPINITLIVTSLTSQIRTLDTVLIIVILCTIIFALFVYSLMAKDALGRRSHVYLEILSARACMQIRLATLPDATRRFVVRVSASTLCIRLQYCIIFGVLHISPKAPRIVNTLTGEVTRLSNYKILLPWTAWQLRRHLAAAPYSVAPMLVHSHEYVFLSSTPPPAYDGQVV